MGSEIIPKSRHDTSEYSSNPISQPRPREERRSDRATAGGTPEGNTRSSSETPTVKLGKALKKPFSGFLYLWVSRFLRCLDFWISALQNCWITELLNFWTSGYPGSRNYGVLDLWVGEHGGKLWGTHAHWYACPCPRGEDRPSLNLWTSG